MKRTIVIALTLAALTIASARAQMPKRANRSADAAAAAEIKPAHDELIPAPAPAVPLGNAARKDTLLCVKGEMFNQAGVLTQSRLVDYDEHGLAVNLKAYDNGATADYAFRYTIDPANDCWTVRSVGRVENGNFVETEREERELDAERRVLRRVIYKTLVLDDETTGQPVEKLVKVNEMRYDYAHPYKYEVTNGTRKTTKMRRGVLVENWENHAKDGFAESQKYEWFEPAERYLQVLDAEQWEKKPWYSYENRTWLDEGARSVTGGIYFTDEAGGEPMFSLRTTTYYYNGEVIATLNEEFNDDATLASISGGVAEFEADVPAGFMQITTYSYDNADGKKLPSARVQMKGKRGADYLECRNFAINEASGAWELHDTQIETPVGNNVFKQRTTFAGSDSVADTYYYINQAEGILTRAWPGDDGGFAIHSPDLWNVRIDGILFQGYDFYGADGRIARRLLHAPGVDDRSIVESSLRWFELKDGVRTPFAGTFKIGSGIITCDSEGFETKVEEFVKDDAGKLQLSFERTTRRTESTLDMCQQSYMPSPGMPAINIGEGRMLDDETYQFTSYTQESEQAEPVPSWRSLFYYGYRDLYKWDSKKGVFVLKQRISPSNDTRWIYSADGLTATKYVFDAPVTGGETIKKVVRRTEPGEHVNRECELAYFYTGKAETWKLQDCTITTSCALDFEYRLPKKPWRDEMSVPGYEYVTSYASLLGVGAEEEPVYNLKGLQAVMHYRYLSGQWTLTDDTQSSLEVVSASPTEVVYKRRDAYIPDGIEQETTATYRKNEAGYLTYSAYETNQTGGSAAGVTTGRSTYACNKFNYLTEETSNVDGEETRRVYIYEPAKVICLGIEDAVAQPAGAFNPALPVYDLSGRRVSTPLRPGIYVQQGRKVIVK